MTMFRPGRKVVLGGVACAAALAGAGALFLLARGRPYDPDFDARVADPAFPSGGSVVLFDEGHRNTHTARGAYKPFVDLVRSDGHELRVATEPVSMRSLEGVAVFVVALARGANDANDDPAFTPEEVRIVERWVRAGGSLLVVTDHWPFGPAARSLVAPFGFEMGGGLVEDPKHCEPSRGESHLSFSAESGLLVDHPIVRGRKPAERVRRVLTFTGQSIAGPAAAVGFLALSATAVERPPTAPTIERSGGDVRVHMEYASPVSATGRAQGLALEVGKGRVVVLGEAGMLRAHRDGQGARVGMNVPGWDNRQLALNVMRWLARAL